MKITIVNGSPRRGNTYTALHAFAAGAEKQNTVEYVDAAKVKVSPCLGCNTCQCQKGCIAKDDSNAVVDTLVASDMIVFGTPVYWWGITAQLKTLIDKCYCKAAYLKGKKIGIIVPGGSPVDAEQYTLIRRQFNCIAEYLNWEIVFFRPYYALEKDDLAKDADAIAALTALGAQIS